MIIDNREKTIDNSKRVIDKSKKKNEKREMITEKSKEEKVKGEITNENSKIATEEMEKPKCTTEYSTSIYSGIYTGSIIVASEIEEIINNINIKLKNTPDNTKRYYFKEEIKRMLKQKVEETFFFAGRVYPIKVKQEFNSLKERLKPDVFNSIEPLLLEYINYI